MAKHWSLEEVESLYARFRPNAVAGQGRQILIADPDGGARSVFASALRQRGFMVVTVEDGLEALRQLRGNRPDCCLFDVQLLPVSGLDLLETINRDPEFRDLPVVICSANREGTDEGIATIYRAASFLPKPAQPEEIVQAIGQALRR